MFGLRFRHDSRVVVDDDARTDIAQSGDDRRSDGHCDAGGTPLTRTRNLGLRVLSDKIIQKYQGKRARPPGG